MMQFLFSESETQTVRNSEVESCEISSSARKDCSSCSNSSAWCSSLLLAVALTVNRWTRLERSRKPMGQHLSSGIDDWANHRIFVFVYYCLCSRPRSRLGLKCNEHNFEYLVGVKFFRICKVSFDWTHESWLVLLVESSLVLNPLTQRIYSPYLQLRWTMR
jgi:hypothetical protein